MFSINREGNIRLTRGDSATFNFKINLGDNMSPFYYQMQEGDELFFGIMEPNQPFEAAIVRKYFTYLDMKDLGIDIKLSPTDTACLMPGLYYYQVKLLSNSTKEVSTLIPKTQLWIEE